MSNKLWILAVLATLCITKSYAQVDKFTLEYLEFFEEEQRMRQSDTHRDTLCQFSETETSDMCSLESECRSTLLTNVKQHKSNYVRDRSLSPWKYIVNYDSRRSPEFQYMLDAVCLCRGCFVPKGGSYVYNDYQFESKPMTIQRSVIVLDDFGQPTINKTIDVTFGCYCSYK